MLVAETGTIVGNMRRMGRRELYYVYVHIFDRTLYQLGNDHPEWSFVYFYHGQ